MDSDTKQVKVIGEFNYFKILALLNGLQDSVSYRAENAAEQWLIENIQTTVDEILKTFEEENV